ncbi:DUF3021 domain-containing protein [Paenibacillus endoradicis]|uniref:DUF3021 domain-containing protein n=1 Tax=Paenibacillus endoradicis TaxID=2972487 RepID=UPI00215977D5|nr:DUF3021 domain-containing protein [Paenibacillus endoradicis]MCR8658712.1 DUF3021 domain-containing protein [Paenibacillus endoradicis]
MNITELSKDIIKTFFIIFGSIIIIITILRQIFFPNMVFNLNSIYIIMIFSLVGALTGFILYSSNDISENNMRVRIIIHFLALEILLISLALVIGVVNSASSILILVLEIAVIYSIVRILSWQNDKKEAQKINEKLKEFKEENI